ncbi:hydrolase [Streptomyces sp. 549]|uniref:alpha/beta hydrolase family protein n=1 Tax=Streptomyces sp. 549 TaxID=3049076 RepID=UPI0024C44F37|nr:alpha/beta family hydrolase [Streptomyces sp. 549]MDK1476691.1 hydrolase [Streptomyces sp. 549]
MSAAGPEPARAVPSGTSLVGTTAGEARITWFRAPGARRVLALGHGAGGGIEARDLQALAAALPAAGFTVALVEQPWRVAGRKLAPAPRALDAAWTQLWPALTEEGVPVVTGGRSAGARVACRTASALGAAAVLALAFPLHPPGRPERSRADELPTGAHEVPLLVVQGGRDTFGRPGEFPDLPSTAALVEVPYADHAFAVPARLPKDVAARAAESGVAPQPLLGQPAALDLLTSSVAEWLDRL